MNDTLQIFARNERKLFKYPNVVGVGIGYKVTEMTRTNQIAIVVFVEKKVQTKALSPEDIIPEQVENVLTDVIEIGRVRLLSRTDKQRPAQPGVSIGHYKVTAGTFGAVVLDSVTKERMILSNNHVLANATNGNDGKSELKDPILQPGSYDGGTIDDKIALLERFVPIIKEEEEPNCSIARGFCATLNWLLKIFRPSYKFKLYKSFDTQNTVDCAIAKPLEAELIDDNIMEIGKVSGVGEVNLGMEVQKSGRTSGFTVGSIVAVGVSLRVALGGQEYAVFSDQIVTDMKSQPGDSGSLVLDKENKAVGLLFAGSEQYTICNKIQNVLSQLKIEF